jgi:hypothetical protein
MITLRLPVGSPMSIEDGGVAAVAVSLSVPRKGSAQFFLLRASLGMRLHQMNEDVETLLLGLSVGSGVVGNGGARWLPAS